VTEILQSIRQSEMTPILQRIYQSEGGSEVCDTLMKYLYKGMGQGQSESAQAAAGGKPAAPQQSGFTQVGGRSFGGAEGGGQAMSVLLSWHEKVSLRRSRASRETVLTGGVACGVGWAGKYCESHV
jgi:actin related protein 2/3 complex subunit 5